MKITVLIIITCGVLIFASTLLAQEQKSGEILRFPKEMVKEHPSDLHMGSDPYYDRDKEKYEGSDEKGYPREYDPNMEYREATPPRKKTEQK